MLRRDITPEEFVKAVRAAMDLADWHADSAPSVRALFETEEEPTPPAGSEEQPASYWKGLVDEWERDNLRLDRENAALRAEVERLKGDRERYQWLKARYAAIDFAYGHAPSDEFPALVFKMDPGMRASGDLDSTIDAARTAGEGRDG